MTTGTVKWFNPAKGFGFIEPEDGSTDAFVHISAVKHAGLATLNEGKKVTYELQPGQNGKSSAENLSVTEYPRKAPSLTPVRDGTVDAVTEDIVVIDNHFSDVDADTKLHLRLRAMPAKCNESPVAGSKSIAAHTYYHR